MRWSQPETRQQLIELLERSGFQEDKLEMMRRFLSLENCDMLDVLSYLAYNTTPIDRKKRADILREEMMKRITKQQMEFVDFILQMYVRNGYKELGIEKLSTLIDMKYSTISDAKRKMNMQPADMRTFFLEIQRQLYST